MKFQIINAETGEVYAEVEAESEQQALEHSLGIPLICAAHVLGLTRVVPLHAMHPSVGQSNTLGSSVHYDGTEGNAIGSEIANTLLSAQDPKRVIVTAHRDWDDFETLQAAVEELEMETVGPVVIVHGGAPGGDTGFAELAIANNGHLGWREEVHRPDYDKYPPRVAPPVRNTEMVKKGAALCIAFYDGRPRGGTVDTMNKARRAGIRVRVWRPGDGEKLFRPQKSR